MAFEDKIIASTPGLDPSDPDFYSGQDLGKDLDARFRPLSTENILEDIFDIDTLTDETGNTTLDIQDDYIDVTVLSGNTYHFINVFNNILNDITNVIIDVEILEMNVENVRFRSQAYYASTAIKDTYFYPADVGKRVVIEHFGLISDGVTGTFDIRHNISYFSGNVIDGGDPTFCKFRLHKYQSIRHNIDLDNYPAMMTLLGMNAMPNRGGVTYLSTNQVDTINRVNSTYSESKRFDLLQITNRLEDLIDLEEKTFNVNSTVYDEYITVHIPDKFLNQDVYLLHKCRVTLNSSNVDIFNIRKRFSGTPDAIILSITRIGVGSEYEIYFQSKVNRSSSDLTTYLSFGGSLCSTGGVSSVGYDSADVNCSLTIHEYVCWISKDKIPNYYLKFMSSYSSEDIFIKSFVDENIQELTGAIKGDSISALAWTKYIQSKECIINFDVYGLRSAISGTGGVCENYNDLNEDYDILITNLGTHDWGRDTVIGDISNGDIDTYIGAFEQYLLGVAETYPDTHQIVLGITPRNLINDPKEFNFNRNYNNDTIADFNNALEKLCNVHGVEYVNPFIGVNANNMTSPTNLYTSYSTVQSVSLVNDTVIGSPNITISSTTEPVDSNIIEITKGFDRYVGTISSHSANGGDWDVVMEEELDSVFSSDATCIEGLALYTDNTKINKTTGLEEVDTDWFVTPMYQVSQGKLWGAVVNYYVSEYDVSGTYLRSGTLSETKGVLHPNTTQVKLSVNKVVTIVDNTPIGTTPYRFWIGDITNATMLDRIHPTDSTLPKIASVVSPVIDKYTTGLNSKNNTDTSTYSVYNI